MRTQRLGTTQLRTWIDDDPQRDIVIYTLPYGNEQRLQTRVLTLEKKRRSDGATQVTTPAYLKIWCESEPLRPWRDTLRKIHAVRAQHDYVLARVEQIREDIESFFAS